MIKFSQRLKELRESLGMNKAQFADYVGIARSSVTRYENNANEVSLGVAEDIADKVGVSRGWLIGWSDDRYSDYVGKYKTIPRITKYPVLPILDSKNFDGFQVCNENLDVDCVFTITDNSMSNTLNNSDAVFIKLTSDIRDGLVAAILLDKQLVCRRINFIGDNAILRNDNTSYVANDIIIKTKDLNLIGEVKFKFGGL